MPYSITTKDGITLHGIPDDVPADSPELKARVQAIRGGNLERPPEGPQTTRNNDLASQLGLTLRSGLKGALALPAMGADALGGALNAAQDLVLGKGGGFRFQQTLPTIDKILNSAGVPQPDTPTQRIVGRAVESATGAGVGAKLAGLAGDATSGVSQAVLQRMAANPTAQVVGGATGGAAGQQSAENGGGWGSQFLSSLLGGIAGGGATMAGQSAANSVRNMLTPKTAPQDIERTVTAIFTQQGIDPASISPAIKSAIMDDAKAALKVGGSLDGEALSRLLDYRRLGATPTLGRVTLNPLDVTREQNAMRMAAATGAADAQLPAIAQGNNRTLLGAIDKFNPITDRVGLGERVTAPIMAKDAALNAQVGSLYQAARDSSGRSLPLEGGTFARMANEALDQANVDSFLPSDIANKMNAIAAGKYPLTVDVAEQLKTSLGNLSRNSTDGNVRTALGIVRKALDNAPLQDSAAVNPGGLPAFGSQVPPSVAGGQASIDAFNAARTAARQRFGWQESTPAIARTLEGAAPDTFLQREILSKSAATADVQKLVGELAQAPDALQAVRSGIVQHLKDAAIGKGNSAETANFSGRGWLSALDGIGDQKLKLFFNPEELAQLKAIGRVGTIETFQPRGSAVNNSNTAAGVAGMVQGASKYLQPLVNKLPGGQALVGQPLNNITLSLMERGAVNAPRGLLVPTPKNGGLLDPLLLPGLLSSVNP